MHGTRALDALMEGLVDYAGLFPPAALPMSDAVRAFAGYAQGPDGAMLGRFVLPLARADEFVAAVRALGPTEAPTARVPWRLSVLAGAPELAALASFRASAPAHVIVDSLEAKAESVEAVHTLAHALATVPAPPLRAYVELPVREDPAALVAALRAHGLRAKIRTGGVVADAFPSPAEVLRFLRRCHAAGVPFKATAGLHHPLRGEYALTYAPDSARGTMYGFLNVFLAAVLLRDGASDEVLLALLEERDPRAVVVDVDGIRWRGARVGRDRITDARATFADSFGSCSFEEPTRELPSITMITR